MSAPVDPEILRERRKIGDRIRSLRLGRDLSQEGLAEAVGADRKTISRAENGVHAIDIDLAIRIARALRVPTHWLFTDEWSRPVDHLPDSARDT